MSFKSSMFFIGGTGYIGGAILELFLDNPKCDITVLVRDAAKAQKLTDEFGVRAVVGSMDDLYLIEKESSNADVVLQVSIVWNFQATEAMLNGMKSRFEKTGVKPILIYTSGGGALVTDNALGEFPALRTNVDTDTENIANLPQEHIHHKGDTMVRLADEDGGYVRTYTIMPSTVWGRPRGRLSDAGIRNQFSQPVPAMVRASLARGQGSVIGKGLNRWSHIEVHEMAELYRLVIERALQDTHLPSGRNGVYFGENGAYDMIDCAKAYTKALYDAGKSRTAEPTPFTNDEITTLLGPILARYIGSSSVCRAERGRALGWKPVLGTGDFIAGMKFEVNALIADSEKSK